MVSEVNFDEGKVNFLSQLIDSLLEAELKLETAYEKKDYLTFNKLKKFIFDVQGQIDQVLS